MYYYDMRIVAGKYGGRTIVTPKGHHTHPMSEKMRGAMFNMLGDIEDLTVLDAYAGSGAVAIEALSRGAKHAYAIDIDVHATGVINQNIKALGLNKEEIKVIRANSAKWSEGNYTTNFNLVICDPPYDDIKLSQLEKLTQNVKKDGLFILSLPSSYPRPIYEGFKLELDRHYGDGSLVFYRKI